MAEKVCDKLIDERPWAKYTDADERDKGPLFTYTSADPKTSVRE